jgi:hypothetical protein
MEQSPSWEANRFVSSQEIPRVLLNPKGHYRIHNCSSPVSILSQLNPVHTPTSNFLKIHSNIILPSTPGSPQYSLSHRFPHQNHIHASLRPQPHYMPRPAYSSWFYHPHNIEWGVQIMSSSLWNLLHSPVTSSLLGSNILLSSTPCSQTPSAYVPPNWKNHSE